MKNIFLNTVDVNQLNIAQYFPWYSKSDNIDNEKYSSYSKILQTVINPGREALIYVHVPYCLSICAFCHCDRILIPDDKKLGPLLDQYLEGLFQEIEIYSEMPYVKSLNIRHIHIGGGTPSLMSTEQLKRLVSCLKSRFNLGHDIALHFEGEVRTLKQWDKLKLLKELNAQRISFGVQSFDSQIRELCNLKPKMQDIKELVDMLREMQMEANIDLIYGLPKQTDEVLRRDLDMVKQLKIDSVDCYRNVVYPNLPLFQKYRHDYPEIIDEKNKMRLYSVIYEELTAAGYKPVSDEVFNLPTAHYSAIKQESTKCGEKRVDLIGIGHGAISYIDSNYARNGHNETYVQKVRNKLLPIVRLYKMTEDEEYTFMGIKGLGCGLKVEVTDRYYPEFRARYRQVVENLIEEGFAIETDKYLQLTEKGILHHSLIQLAFLSDEQRQRMKRFSYDNVWKGAEL